MSEEQKKPAYTFPGRHLSQKERMEHYRQQADAIGPRVDPPQGKPRTRDELLRDLRQADKVRERIEQQVAERVPTEVVSPYARQIADLEEKRAHGSPVERPGIDRRLRIYRKAEQDWQAEQQSQAARAAYDANESVVLMREHAQAFARTPPEGSDGEAVSLAYATAMTGLYDNPEAHVKQYWSDVAKIESAAEEKIRQQRAESVFAVRGAIEALDKNEQALVEASERLSHAKAQIPAEGGENGN